MNGLYQISNYGRVKSFKYKNPKILKPGKTNQNGYYVVTLSKNNIKKYKTIHRLVAMAFIANPNNYPIINHRNCDKYNNKVENLEWCTISFNVLHAIKNGKINIEYLKSKIPHYYGKQNHNARAVFVYDLYNKYIGKFGCIKEAKDNLNINKPNSSTHIVQCCKGERKTAYGYKWRYADERNSTS